MTQERDGWGGGKKQGVASNRLIAGAISGPKLTGPSHHFVMIIKIIIIKMNCFQSSNNFLLDAESSGLILKSGLVFRLSPILQLRPRKDTKMKNQNPIICFADD